MSFAIALSHDAERDIEDIYRYIQARESADRADHVLAALEEAIARLADLPERGNIPKELAGLGIRDFREVHFKPYRIIYRTHDDTVIVYCVVDGRRDMQSLLERRLLR